MTQRKQWNSVMPLIMNGKKRKKSSTKGISKHPLYLVRRAMIHRCYNPKVNCYHNYGGRGIRVCDEWILNQEAFISFCELNGWKRGLVLDRIDNDGNYEPSNIKFSTPKESSRNTRTNVNITINGVTKILEDWCQFYNISSKLVQSRIKRSGWTPEVAVKTPVFENGDGFKRNTLSISQAEEIRFRYKSGGLYQHELAKQYGVSIAVISGIILNKWAKYKT